MTPWVIVVAAGSGSRFGAPKQLLDLGGRPMWERAVDAFRRAGLAELVVVGPVPGGRPGGERRRDSVRAGLDAVPFDAEFVLVHDAARPLVAGEVIERVVARLAAGDVAGVVPAVPVRDTIKRTRGEAVTETLDRGELAAVQTPQGFQVEWLRRAHAVFEGDATDDAGMVESIGGKVVVVDGDPTNIKVTYPEDLVVAEALLAARTRTGGAVQ